MIFFINFKSIGGNEDRSPIKSGFSAKADKGQTLIEAIVALVALLITLAAISISIVIAISNSTYVKNQNLASKYAQQGMEYFRNLKANNSVVPVDPPEYFKTLSGDYCFDDDNNLTKSNGDCVVNISDNQISFKRKVNFENNPSLCNGTKVTVSVSWTSGKCTNENNRYCHKSQLVSCFTDQPGNQP